MPNLPDPSLTLLASFCTLVVATTLAALTIVRRVSPSRFGKSMIVVVVWTGVWGGLAASGVLGKFDTLPPPFALAAMTSFVLVALWVRSDMGRELATQTPLAWLLLFQSFRVPLELTMHRAYTEGLMPVQMSFSGHNFDILSGVFGLVLGVWALKRQPPKAVLWLYTIGGLALLATIVGIALASTPTFAAYGPDALNVWVTVVPFVYLPAIFVMLAFAGHLLMLRRLIRDEL